MVAQNKCDMNLDRFGCNMPHDWFADEQNNMLLILSCE